MQIQRIALTTDFSACAREAYAPVVDFARRTGAAVDLVHCVEYPFQYIPPGFQGGDEALVRYREYLKRKLDEEVSSPVLAPIREKARLEPRLLDGYGPDALSKLAEKSAVDLIAQASHGHTGLKRLLLGSFAERVVRSSAVPVLTFKVRDPQAGASPKGSGAFHPRTILCPHDFSACASHSLDAVRFLARLYGSRVIVVHVWRDVPELQAIHGIGGEAVSVELASICAELPKRLSKELKELGARELEGIEHEEHFVRGDPARTIVARAAACGADLVCMSTHGWTGLKHVLLGSVAERVAREAACPVLTVRPPHDLLKEDLPGRSLPRHPIY